MQQVNHVPLIDFAIEIIIFQPPRYGQLSPDNRQKMYLQRTSGCTKQNSLQEQTELEALGENIKIILTFSYLAVPK